jgi:nucleoside-diphosphate-sugar epimerase
MYQQRTTDVAVFESGMEVGVPTTIIMAPTVFGIGSGPVNKLSIQIPTLIRRSLQYDQAVVVGDGAGEWDHVHIADLAELFELVLEKVLSEEESIPSGEDGLLFAETGRHTWLEISQGIASTGHDLKAIGTEGVRNVSLEEATTWSANGSLQVRELGFASK